MGSGREAVTVGSGLCAVLIPLAGSLGGADNGGRRAVGGSSLIISRL